MRMNRFALCLIACLTPLLLFMVVDGIATSATSEAPDTTKEKASGEDLGECRAGAATVPVSAAKCTGTYTCCSPGNSCITLTHAVDCAGADPSTTWGKYDSKIEYGVCAPQSPGSTETCPKCAEFLCCFGHAYEMDMGSCGDQYCEISIAKKNRCKL